MAIKRKKKWNVWILLVIILILVIVAMVFGFQKIKPQNISNQTKNETENKPWVSPTIYEKFEQGAVWVEVVIELDSEESAKGFNNSLPASDFNLRQGSYIKNMFDGNITKKGLENLLKNKHVRRIGFKIKMSQALDVSVPLINVNDSVWNLGYTGEGKGICIVDTGTNYSSPYLGGGWGNIVIGGWNVFSDNNNTMDLDGHGTRLAGIIASSYYKYKGVAFNAKIISVKCTNDKACEPQYLKEGIRWCVDHYKEYNISVISISMASTNTFYDSLCDEFQDVSISSEVENATNHGISIVIATGNNGNKSGISWPSCVNNTIPVGNTYKQNYSDPEPICVHYDIWGNCTKWCDDAEVVVDSFVCSSNRGKLLSLVAPGCGIVSINATTGDTWNVGCGTSDSAPHIGAAIALLLEMKSDLTPDQTRDVLNLTGKLIYDANASNRTYSRIDVHKAIMAVNASLLQTNLSVLNKSGTYAVFELIIRNANLSNISNIAWQVNVGDGNITVSNTSKNMSLLFGEAARVIFAYNYSAPGFYNVTATAIAGNLNQSKSVGVTIEEGGLLVKDIKDLYTNGYSKFIEFKIKNTGTAIIQNVNWTVDFGDNSTTTNNQSIASLSEGEEILVYISHTYSSLSSYTINISSSAFNESASQLATLSYNIRVPGISVLNSSAGKGIFEFIIRNPLPVNLTNVNWTLDFGNTNTTSSNQSIMLITNEKIRVIAEHEYASSGTYQVNATARNGTLIDSQITSFNVTV